RQRRRTHPRADAEAADFVGGARMTAGAAVLRIARGARTRPAAIGFTVGALANAGDTGLARCARISAGAAVGAVRQEINARAVAGRLPGSAARRAHAGAADFGARACRAAHPTVVRI